MIAQISATRCLAIRLFAALAVLLTMTTACGGGHSGGATRDVPNDAAAQSNNAGAAGQQDMKGDPGPEGPAGAPGPAGPQGPEGPQAPPAATAPAAAQQVNATGVEPPGPDGARQYARAFALTQAALLGADFAGGRSAAVWTMQLFLSIRDQAVPEFNSAPGAASPALAIDVGEKQKPPLWSPLAFMFGQMAEWTKLMGGPPSAVQTGQAPPLKQADNL